MLGSAAILVPGGYLGYQATIGGRPSDELCFVNARPHEKNPAARAVGYSSTQKWAWWPSKYVFTCVYDMPGGKTLVRPPPSSK